MLSEEKLSKIIGDIADNYEQEDLFTIESGHQLPNRDAVIHIIMGLRQIMFPGYFDKEHLERTIPEYFLGHNIIRIYDTLSEQIRFALIREAKSQANLTEIKERTEEICEQFFSSFAHIQQLLLKDVQAAFDGDPAAKTKARTLQSMGFDFDLAAAVGCDVRSEYESWTALVGQYAPFYLAGRRFGPANLQLTGVSLSDTKLDNLGRILTGKITIKLTEYAEEASSKKASSGKSSSSSKSAAGIATYKELGISSSAVNVGASSSAKASKKPTNAQLK